MHHRLIMRVHGPSLVTVIAFTMFVAVSPIGAQSPAELFAPIAKVMRHPRCVNCHVETIPLNGENGRPHPMKITRGARKKDADADADEIAKKNNFGAPGAPCYACHRETAVSKSSSAPAAKDWQLAPEDMAWQGKTDPQLCARLKETIAKPRWGPANIIKHFKDDPLVKANWQGNPPVRPKVPDSQEQVVAAVEAWLKAQQPCP